MINEDKAVELAKLALRAKKFRIVEDTLHISYENRRLLVGKDKKGWVVSFSLDVPKSFEPNFVIVHVSDPEGIVRIPDVY